MEVRLVINALRDPGGSTWLSQSPTPVKYKSAITSHGYHDALQQVRFHKGTYRKFADDLPPRDNASADE